MDDKGFVYLDDAQSLLGKNSQEYWGICDMIVSANWQKEGVYYKASERWQRNAKFCVIAVDGNDIQGGQSMICKFWDAQKERHVGEWTEDNE
eukprot:9080712-Ditylum_brightwellii.AAC.1